MLIIVQHVSLWYSKAGAAVIWEQLPLYFPHGIGFPSRLWFCYLRRIWLAHRSGDLLPENAHDRLQCDSLEAMTFSGS